MKLVIILEKEVENKEQAENLVGIVINKLSEHPSVKIRAEVHDDIENT